MTTLLRAADRIAVPWKNGGGVTRKVAVWPPGAGFDDFDWRVSIAEVRAAGPFSVFPGIDRTMAILEGRLRLGFVDRTVELSPDSRPFGFSGDVACSGEPIGRPVTDLNVMVRRGRCTARLERATHGTLRREDGFVLIVARAATQFAAGAEAGELDPGDACLIEPLGPDSLCLAGDAHIVFIGREGGLP